MNAVIIRADRSYLIVGRIYLKWILVCWGRSTEPRARRQRRHGRAIRAEELNVRSVRRCLRCVSLTASTLQASRRPGSIFHSPCLPHAISVPARDPCIGPRSHALVRLHHGPKLISRAAVSPARFRCVFAQARSVTVPCSTVERVQKRASNVLKLTQENEKLAEELKAMSARLEAIERRRQEIANRQLQQTQQQPSFVADSHPARSQGRS